MNTNEFMGLLVGCLLTLLTLIGLIVKPIINLNSAITKLSASIEALIMGQRNLEIRIEKQAEEINANHDHLIGIDKDLDHIKEAMK